MRELESGIIEGKVITGGIAQTVHRKGDIVHVRLAFMPGVQMPPDGKIDFPEPVMVPSGHALVLEIDDSYVSPPLRVGDGMVVKAVDTRGCR